MTRGPTPGFRRRPGRERTRCEIGLIRGATVMRQTTWLALFALVLVVLPGFAQQQAGPYGSIADLKLTKPEDAKDTPSMLPPSGAVVLFDGKSLDNWVKRDGKSPASWKLVDSAMQVQGGDIITKEKFDGT